MCCVFPPFPRHAPSTLSLTFTLSSSLSWFLPLPLPSDGTTGQNKTACDAARTPKRLGRLASGRDYKRARMPSFSCSAPVQHPQAPFFFWDPFGNVRGSATTNMVLAFYQNHPVVALTPNDILLIFGDPFFHRHSSTLC